MLLFKLCFYWKHASTSTSSVYTVQCTHCHVCSVQVNDACMLLFKSCFCVTARFEKSAYIRVMLQYGSCFNMGHASIWVMLQYGSCFNMGHASIWVMLQYGSCFNMGHASIWVMLQYGSCFNMGHASIWVMLQYGSCFYMGHAFIHDTRACQH